MWNSRVHFTTTQDNTLVGMISKRAAIFDPGHKLYKDHTLRDRIWKEISLKVGRSLIECKKRWRSVRDTYGRMKRLQRIKPDRNFTKWPLARQLKFLDDVDPESGPIKGTDVRADTIEQHKSHLGNYTSNCLYNQNSLTNLEDSLDDPISGTYFASNTFNEKPLDSQPGAADPQRDEANIPRPTSSHKELSATSVLEQKAADRMEIVREILKLKVPTICNDPVDAFFYGMAASVKRMPPKLKAEAKMRVCKIIVELELKASQDSQLPEVPMMCSKNLIYPKGEPEDIESVYDQSNGGDEADILGGQFEMDIHKFD